MTTIEEDVALATQYGEEKAHVAALMRYRTAIDNTGYDSGAAQILLDAVKYAQNLKKGSDRKEVAVWAEVTIAKITPKTNLVGIIEQEIGKLKVVGEPNATSQ